jgi:predicted CoA-binding protein
VISDYQNSEKADKILHGNKIIAVVGLSDKPERQSYRVAKYLQQSGYKIIPVNPRISEVLGEKAYPDLESIPGEIDVVDVFRKSEEVLPIVKSAIAIGAKAIWLQEGIYNEEAAKLAEEAGIDFIMGLCMFQEHSKHGS